MDYIAELSNPKLSVLVYYCDKCANEKTPRSRLSGGVYVFREFPLFPGKWGTSIMKVANLKRAGFLTKGVLARESKVGVYKGYEKDVPVK